MVVQSSLCVSTIFASSIGQKVELPLLSTILWMSRRVPDLQDARCHVENVDIAGPRGRLLRAFLRIRPSRQVASPANRAIPFYSEEALLRSNATSTSAFLANTSEARHQLFPSCAAVGGWVVQPVPQKSVLGEGLEFGANLSGGRPRRAAIGTWTRFELHNQLHNNFGATVKSPVLAGFKLHF
jgi:hypothetical protein